MEARTRQVQAFEAPVLRITLAGEVSLRSANGTVGEERLAGRQGRLLFAYLVTMRGRPVPRDHLSEVLWGESPPTTWEKALTVLVSKLRSALTECGLDATSALTGARGYYRLDLPDNTWLDLDAAAADAKEAAAALAADRLDDSIAAAGAALETIRRPFLPGDESSWVEARRRELADLADEALACLADAHLAAGRTGEAARVAEEAIALQPFRESGYRRLMQAHAAAGNRAEALRVYDRCRRLLLEELGAYPSPETEAIFQELLKQPSRDTAQRPAADAADQDAAEPTPASAPPVDARSPRRPRRRLLGVAAIAAVVAGAIVAAIVLPADEKMEPIGPRSLAAINLATARPAANVRAERDYKALAVGAHLWAVDPANSAVVRLDPGDASVRDTIPVGADPRAVVSSFGSAWVANGGDGTISRVSPERGAVVQTLAGGNGPSALAAGAGSIWVAATLDSAIVRIDPRAGRVRATIPVSSAPTGLAFAAGSLWVAGGAAGVVFRIDPAANAVAESISVGRDAEHVGSAGGSIWVSNAGDHTVSRIDPRKNAVTAIVPLGGAPTAVTGAGGSLWVARDKPAALLEIDPARAQVARTIRLQVAPRALAGDGRHLWLATGTLPRPGGTLRIRGTVDDSTLDPAFGANTTPPGLLAVVYDGLVGFKRVGGTAGMTIVPDLARSLPAPTGGSRAYRFELRELRFADGTRVRATDVRHTFERLMRLESPGAGYYSAIRGADTCSRRRCDLARGIVTDDRRGTVVFHLARPDPEFMTKLALPFAWVLPSSTRTGATGTNAPAGTGPYRIASSPGKAFVLVRNPRFRVWAPDAQPRGNPDRIEVTNFAGAGNRSIGNADIVSITPLPDEAQEILARYAGRIRTAPLAANLFMFLNTDVAPFDDVRVRRALNFAVDRARIAQLAGAPLIAQSSCQVLPPALLGYRPYCPYARGPRDAGVWTGPDVLKARQLAATSRRRGTKVSIWTTTEFKEPARELAATLRLIGFPARAKVVAPEQLFTAPRNRVQATVSYWLGDYPSPVGFLFGLFRCGQPEPNFSGFCEPRSQTAMRRAARESDVGAAGRLWSIADRRLTDAAPVVPLATTRTITIVSPRVQNYQYHPQWGPLVDQMSIADERRG